MTQIAKSALIKDDIAERLESLGLWRRAATRWLEVMHKIEHTTSEREWIRQRRIYCQSRVAPVTAPELLNLSDISQAAKATQARMGIDRPGGKAFRMQGIRTGKRKNRCGSCRAGSVESENDI